MPANTAAMVLIYLEKLLDLTSQELIQLELLDNKYNSRKGKRSIIDGLIYHLRSEANLDIQLSPTVAFLLFEARKVRNLFTHGRWDEIEATSVDFTARDLIVGAADVCNSLCDAVKRKV